MATKKNSNKILIRIKEAIPRKIKYILRKDPIFDENHFKFNPEITKDDYERLAEKCKYQIFPLIDDLEREIGFTILKQWLDELALLTQVTIKKSRPNYQHGRVVYSALRKYIHENQQKLKSSKITILEIGTARGFSAICMSKALLDSKHAGSIISIDPLPHNTKMYWNCIADIDGRSTRKELLKKYQEELSNIVFMQDHSPACLGKLGVERIHFAFVDGMHKHANIVQEYKYIKSHQLPGDIIIFDDIQTAEYSDVGEFVREIDRSGEYLLREIWSAKSRGYAMMTKL